MSTEGKMLIETLIGFASGLYMASTFFNVFFSENSFSVSFGNESSIFVFLIVVLIFSFFGVHCMSDNNKSKIEEELEC